jgi:exopolysaccharide biosynthesis polyprenyl glycosylphosphotransferase
MFSRHNRMVGVLYAAADGSVALLSFWLARRIRMGMVSVRPLYPVSYYLWIVPVVIALWLCVGWLTGLYGDVEETSFRRTVTAAFKVVLLGSLLLFAFIFLTKFPYISRTLLALYAGLDFVLMIVYRSAATAILGRLRSSVGGFRHFLLVGDTPDALEIARRIEASELRGMRLSGFAVVAPQVESGPHLSSAQLRRDYPLYGVKQIPELLRQHVIDEVIFAIAKDELNDLEDIFLACEQEGVKTRLALSFLPHIISKVSLERLREMPLLTFSSTPENEYLILLKRMADLAMSLVLVIILSPLFFLLGVLIKLTSKGPMLYRQIRCGLGGRKFTVYKFRSMKAGAELLREDLRSLNEVDGPVFKIKNDPRCTALGRLMRRLSLDELPQLFNILKGDMSFVGPRPPLPEEVEKYERWQRRRLRMQPGLTCLWAIEGRSRLSFKRWMELDLEYIDHWSLLLDWKILLKTIPAVLLGRGAF